MIGQGCERNDTGVIIASAGPDWVSLNEMTAKADSLIEGTVESVSDPRATTRGASFGEEPPLYFRVATVSVSSDYLGGRQEGEELSLILPGSGLGPEEQSNILCYGRDGIEQSPLAFGAGDEVIAMARTYSIDLPGVDGSTFYASSGWVGVWRIAGDRAISSNEALSTTRADLLEAVVLEEANGPDVALSNALNLQPEN